MRTAFVCIAALGLLQFGLAANVSRNRRKYKASIGVPEDPTDPLYQAVVAHRNTAEHVPMLSILMLALELGGCPNWAVWVMFAAVAGRFLYAFGMLNFTMARPNMARVAGTALTYLSGLVMSLLLLSSMVQRTPGPFH